MIPQKLHYCWFGGAPKSELILRCMESWKKQCPNYEIHEWNEENVSIAECPLYVRQAYEMKKWAYVSDYVRLKIVYEQGGIYLDTDVELVRSPSELLSYKAFFGFEDGAFIATGLCFGAEPQCAIVKELMDSYEGIPFRLPDGTVDLLPCPKRNTSVFLRHGLKQNDRRQVLDGDVLILPSIYLCPLDFATYRMRKSPKTISIHHYAASWMREDEKEAHQVFVSTHRAGRIKPYLKRFIITTLGWKTWETLQKWKKPHLDGKEK